MIPQQEILLLAMKAGQIQLENGAEIFRVEDTIMHICRSYGLHSVNTFVLSNGIFISCGDEQEPPICQGAADSGQSYQSASGGRGSTNFPGGLKKKSWNRKRPGGN